MISDANRQAAQYAVKEATRHHTAIKKWRDWCAGVHAAKRAAGLFANDADYGSHAWKDRSAAVERQYMLTNKRPVMPSERRRHQMYDNAYRAANLAGVAIPAGSIRDLDGVFQVLTSVTAVLAVTP